MDNNLMRPKQAWTTGSTALMVIGLLILIPAALGTAVVGILSVLGGTLPIDVVLIVGGIPILFGAAMVDAARHYRGHSSGRFGGIAFIAVGAVLLIMGGLIAGPFLINALGGTPLGGMDLLRSVWPNAGLVLFLLATLVLGPEPSDFMVALLIGVLPVLIGGALIWAGVRLQRR